MPLSSAAQALRVTILLLAVLSAGSSAARAQEGTATPSPTPSATPENEELRRLRERNAIRDEEKKVAENEKAIAEAKKAALAAQFPAPTATPLEGKTEVDASVKIESQILTYKTMGDAAGRIVYEIKENISDPKAVAVHNERDVRALLSYMAMLRQLRLMNEEYDRLLADEEKKDDGPRIHVFGQPSEATFAGVGATITAAKSVLGGFIDLIALLRTDTSIKGLDVSIEEPALVSEVFKALRAAGGFGPGVKLYYPAAVPPNFNANSVSEFLSVIELLNFRKSRAEEIATKIEENEKALGAKKDEIAALKKRQKQIPDEIGALDKEYEGLQKVHWKWPSSRRAERLEEITRAIARLATELKKNAATLDEGDGKVDELKKTIDELYGQILPMIDPDDVTAALAEAEEKVAGAESLLGTKFNADEKHALFRGLEDEEKKALIKRAEQHRRSPLTDEEKAKLTKPLSKGEADALEAILRKEEETGKPLTPEARVRLLGGGAQTALLGEIDQEVLRRLKKAALLRLKSLNTQYDKMVADLTKTDPAAGTNPLTLYLQSENLRGALVCADTSEQDADPCPGSYLLQLKVLVAGGNTKTKKNLITNVFTGADISHSGGSIVQFNLYDMTGASKASDTFGVYEGYTSAKNIKHLSEDAGEKEGGRTGDADAVRRDLYKRFNANRRSNPGAAYQTAKAFALIYPDDQGRDAASMRKWAQDYERSNGGNPAR